MPAQISCIAQKLAPKTPTVSLGVAHLATAVPQTYVLEERQTEIPATKILSAQAVLA